MEVDWTECQETRLQTKEWLDKYTVPDFPYNPAALPAEHPGQKDRFEGYRALEPEDWNHWQRAIEDANS